MQHSIMLPAFPAGAYSIYRADRLPKAGAWVVRRFSDGQPFLAVATATLWFPAGGAARYPDEITNRYKVGPCVLPQEDPAISAPRYNAATHEILVPVFPLTFVAPDRGSWRRGLAAVAIGRLGLQVAVFNHAMELVAMSRDGVSAFGDFAGAAECRLGPSLKV